MCLNITSEIQFQDLSILNTCGKVILPGCSFSLISESSMNELCSDKSSENSSLSGPLISASSCIKILFWCFGIGWQSEPSDELETILLFRFTGRSKKIEKFAKHKLLFHVPSSESINMSAPLNRSSIFWLLITASLRKAYLRPNSIPSLSKGALGQDVMSGDPAVRSRSSCIRSIMP